MTTYYMIEADYSTKSITFSLKNITSDSRGDAYEQAALIQTNSGNEIMVMDNNECNNLIELLKTRKSSNV